MVQGRWRVLGRVGAHEDTELYEVQEHPTFPVRMLKLFSGAALTPSSERWERFARETERASTLLGARVPRVMALGVEDSTARPYVVTEKLELPSLADHIAEGVSFTHGEVVELLCQLAPLLDRLHAAGLVHGNLKPTNLFFPRSRPRELKLTDLGAQLLTSDTVGGPAGWCAPELLRPDTWSTPASDLYAVGLLTFFALTGHPAFPAAAGRDRVALEEEQLAGLRAPSARAATLGKELDTRLDRWFWMALDPSPGRRFASATEMVLALGSQLGLRLDLDAAPLLATPSLVPAPPTPSPAASPSARPLTDPSRAPAPPPTSSPTPSSQDPSFQEPSTKEPSTKEPSASPRAPLAPSSAATEPQNTVAPRPGPELVGDPEAPIAAISVKPLLFAGDLRELAGPESGRKPRTETASSPAGPPLPNPSPPEACDPDIAGPPAPSPEAATPGPATAGSDSGPDAPARDVPPRSEEPARDQGPPDAEPPEPRAEGNAPTPAALAQPQEGSNAQTPSARPLLRIGLLLGGLLLLAGLGLLLWWLLWRTPTETPIPETRRDAPERAAAPVDRSSPAAASPGELPDATKEAPGAASPQDAPAVEPGDDRALPSGEPQPSVDQQPSVDPQPSVEPRPSSKTRASVVFECSPVPCQSVFCDAKRYDAGTVELEPGRHTCKGAARGYGTSPVTLDLAPGQTLRHTFTLVPRR